MSSPSYMRHWLITAFDPFDKRPHNTSMLVLGQIKNLVQNRSDLSPFEFHFAILPTVYDRSFEVLLDQMKALPKLEGILSLGEGRDRLVVETLAHNLDHRPNAQDNAGNERSERPIIPTAPPTLPIPFPYAAFDHLAHSDDPGRFVCNHLCFRASHFFAGTNTHFGFIHVPRLENSAQDADRIIHCANEILKGFKQTTS